MDSPPQESGKSADTLSSSGASPQSSSSAPLSLLGELNRVLGIVGAAAGTFMLTEVVPPEQWKYKFWGTVGIWCTALLPRPTFDLLVMTVVQHLPWTKRT